MSGLVEDFEPDLTDRDQIREAWRSKAQRLVRLESRARQLVEGRKILLSRLTLNEIASGTAVTKADKLARTCEEFAKYLRTMFDAQEDAAALAVEVENLNRLYYEHAAREANERAERRMTPR